MFRPRLLVVPTLLIALAAVASQARAATRTVVLRRIAVTGNHAPGTPPDVTFFGEFENDGGAARVSLATATVQGDRRRARADPPRRHASTGTRSRHHTRLPVSVPR